MGVATIFVKENGWARHLAGHMVEVRDHVQQLVLAMVLVGRHKVLDCTAPAEESLVDLGPVDGKGATLVGIGTKAAAVFVDIVVMRRRLAMPDAAVAGRFGAEDQLGGRGGHEVCHRDTVLLELLCRLRLCAIAANYAVAQNVLGTVKVDSL